MDQKGHIVANTFNEYFAVDKNFVFAEKISLWMRLKLWLFGKRTKGLADGHELDVYIYNDVYYVTGHRYIGESKPPVYVSGAGSVQGKNPNWFGDWFDASKGE